MNVPDVKPRTFAVFMSWLYTQTIKTPDDDEWDLKLDEEYKAIRADDANKPHSDQVLRDFVKRNEQAALFLRLYYFADEYDVPSLRQQVMQTWPVLWRSMSYRYLIRPSPVIEILERLPLSSALCQGLVYAYVYLWKAELAEQEDQNDFAKLPKDFLVVVLTTASNLAGALKGDWPEDFDFCHSTGITMTRRLSNA